MPVYNVFSTRKGGHRRELWDEVRASSPSKAITKAKKRASNMKKQARSKNLKATLTRTNWKAELNKNPKFLK